jgi:hypothetical protein
MGADMIEVIDVKYQNFAAEGKKYGSVVDVTGDRYPCPERLVAAFEPGQRVQCEVQDETLGDKQVRVIKKLLPKDLAVFAGASGAAPTADDELRFVLSLAPAFIQSGRIPDTVELTGLIEKLRAVYAETFGGAS